jgi:hypothetical protein
MIFERKDAEKLQRYLINSDPFLWGILIGKNKKLRIKALNELGFLKGYRQGSNPIYSRIYQDLLLETGIEGILEQIVVPGVLKLFKPEQLRFFRRCWEQGQTPDLKYLDKENLYRVHATILFDYPEIRQSWRDQHIVGFKDPANVFLQIDRQNEFIERWTVFAGLWFEEIEPLLGTKL